MTDTILKIEGMTCQHCVMSVEKAVDSVIGVSSSDVTIGSVKVAYDESSVDRKTIAAAIQNAGYKVIE